MKTVITTILITVCALEVCNAQQDSLTRAILNWRTYKETVITFGYNYNPATEEDTPNPKRLHFLEVGVWRTYASFVHHPVYATYYAATDIGLNTGRFVMGPKIGGFVGVMMWGLGGEISYYTDFDEGTLRFSPQFGFATPYFKLMMSPNIPLTNKNFDRLNSVSINLTIRAIKIKRTDL